MKTYFQVVKLLKNGDRSFVGGAYNSQARAIAFKEKKEKTNPNAAYVIVTVDI
jgi:hypothetical protein